MIQNIKAEQIDNSTWSAIPPVKRYQYRYKYIQLLLMITSVVFSYWTKMLDLVQNALQQAGFLCERIDGQYSIKRREKALYRFANDPCCTVMLATIGSGGEG
jgi:SNF2 family DNA or RNA helicase